jgi:predicted DNA-binding protein
MGRIAKTNAAVAAEPKGESPPPATRGTKMVSASLDRAFSRQLKSLSIDQGRPMAVLLQEALNDLFVKYRKDPIEDPTCPGKGAPGESQVSFRMTLPRQLEERLGRLMQQNDWSGGELLRKAFALVEIAEDAREQGNRLGIITKNHQVLAEVIAL